MMRDIRRASLVAICTLLFACVATAGTKTVSGELRSLKDKVLTVQKIGLFSKGNSTVEIEINDATKISGQLAPGMHVKVKYRQDGDKKTAVEVVTRPEYASKEGKKAAGQTPK